MILFIRGVHRREDPSTVRNDERVRIHLIEIDKYGKVVAVRDEACWKSKIRKASSYFANALKAGRLREGQTNVSDLHDDEVFALLVFMKWVCGGYLPSPCFQYCCWACKHASSRSDPVPESKHEWLAKNMIEFVLSNAYDEWHRPKITCWGCNCNCNYGYSWRQHTWMIDALFVSW